MSLALSIKIADSAIVRIVVLIILLVGGPAALAAAGVI